MWMKFYPLQFPLVQYVASLLAATLYQGNPDRNHKLWNMPRVSTERLYTPYAGAAGMLLHINDKKSLKMPNG